MNISAYYNSSVILVVYICCFMSSCQPGLSTTISSLYIWTERCSKMAKCPRKNSSLWIIIQIILYKIITYLYKTHIIFHKSATIFIIVQATFYAKMPKIHWFKTLNVTTYCFSLSYISVNLIFRILDLMTPLWALGCWWMFFTVVWCLTNQVINLFIRKFSAN